MCIRDRYIYKIDHCCDKAGFSYEERKAKRLELAKPVMEAMKVWVETEGIKYSPNSLAGKAITYAYTRWDNMMMIVSAKRYHHSA